jgi:hypothetical protein
VRFAYLTGWGIEGKQTHALRKSKTLPAGTKIQSYKLVSVGDSVYSVYGMRIPRCYLSHLYNTLIKGQIRTTVCSAVKLSNIKYAKRCESVSEIDDTFLKTSPMHHNTFLTS